VAEIIYKSESYRLLVLASRRTTKKVAGFWNPFIKSAWASSFNTRRFRRSPNRRLVSTIVVGYSLTDEHRAQLLNYLHAMGFELGLLVNFGHYPGLEYEGIAKTKPGKVKPDFPMFLFDLFASIRVIRGLIL